MESDPAVRIHNEEREKEREKKCNNGKVYDHVTSYMSDSISK